MSYDNHDDLDRLLFALPLEEPPADLRVAILTATVYRPAPVFSALEVSGMGAAAAVAVWLIVLISMGGGTLFAHSVDAVVGSAGRMLRDPALAMWLAAGGATAVWLTLFTRFQPRQKVGERSGR